MNHQFMPLITPPKPLPAQSLWFIFQGNRLLVYLQEEAAALPDGQQVEALALPFQRQHYLGVAAAAEPLHCFAAEVTPEFEAADGMDFWGLRRLYGRLPETYFWLAGRAVQIIDWDRTHLYCSRCSTPNEQQTHERAKKCPDCGLITYPRISPAIIVRVTRETPQGTEILLARGARHPAGFYSVLAGFVEPGETLEDTVHREIKEEVGITVKNVSYFGSQPWPFPNSLMLAFTADYAGGDLVLEEEEIEDAQWFTPATMPHIPPSISISRTLIDDYLAATQTP